MSGSPPPPSASTTAPCAKLGVNVGSAKRLLEGVLDAPTPVLSGAKWVAPTTDELAPFFPKYKILNLIGRGGMGAVYLALDPELNRQVAIKLLPPHLADQPGFQERFRQEALSLARLDHENVVRIHEYGPKAAPLSFVMDYVMGQNLAELLRQQRAAKAKGAPPVLSFSQMITLAGQICAGVQAAHEHDIIHRDIKPANIMINSRGKVKVADFGLASEIIPLKVDSKVTREHEVMGTLEYMAPEVRNGQSPTPQSDIYAIGVVLYEMLTGGLPQEPFLAPSRLAPLHPRVDAIVLKAMHHDAAQRFPDVASLAVALHHLRPGDGNWHRWPRPIKVFLTLSIAGAVTALAMVSRPTPPQNEEPKAVPESHLRSPLAAGLLYEESFDYPTGRSNLPAAGGYVSKVAGGPAADIVPGSMVYVDAAGNQLLTHGNSAHANADRGGAQIDDVAPLRLPAETPRVIWFSCVAQQTAGTTSRFFNVSLRADDDTNEPPDLGGADDEILAIGLPSDAPLQQWQIWDRAAGLTTRRTAVSTVTTTKVAFLLVQMELNVNPEGCERFTLWINPRLDQAPPASAETFTTAYSNVKQWPELTKLRLGAGASPLPGQGAAFLVDEIRIGTNAAAVMPIARG